MLAHHMRSTGLLYRIAILTGTVPSFLGYLTLLGAVLLNLAVFAVAIVDGILLLLMDVLTVLAMTILVWSLILYKSNVSVLLLYYGSLTETCYCSEYHHTDEHHAYSLCLHNCFPFFILVDVQ